jgi:CSLREA domain-containing protein
MKAKVGTLAVIAALIVASVGGTAAAVAVGGPSMSARVASVDAAGTHVEIAVHGVADLRGFQVVVDTAGVDSGIEPEPVVGLDRGGRDLSIGELDGAAVSAATCRATCPTDVVARVLVPSGAAVASVTVRRALIISGDHAITFPVQTLALAGANAAPTASAERTAALARPRPVGDLNDDRRTDQADVSEIDLAWERAVLAGLPDHGCGPAAPGTDLDADGCTTVADVRDAHETQLDSRTAVPRAALDATFVVTTTGDEADNSVGDGLCHIVGGGCTLRAAIEESNAAPGTNTIAFAIPSTGTQTILLSHHLPTLSDQTGGTTIDGYTQAGSVPNTDPAISNAVVDIAVRGDGTLSDDAFVVTSGGNRLRGLSIYAVRRPVWIWGTAAAANSIVGCFVGTDPSGYYAAPKRVNNGHGIHVEQDAPATVVGSPDPADRNVISGNAQSGVGLWHNGTDGGLVQGNVIGLSPAGDRAIPNKRHGVDLNFGVSDTLVGGPDAADRNLISGNLNSGVEISHTSLTTANTIEGNFIGTDATGEAAATFTANHKSGVHLEDGASGNLVATNVIGGNRRAGVEIVDAGTHGATQANVVRDNWIGVSRNGIAIPNKEHGVEVESSSNVIGPGNVIADNEGAGIRSSASTAVGNRFTQNAIFDNTNIGIDLGARGVTKNDAGDVDDGANHLLNFPIMLQATGGLVSGTACPGCTVELFVSSPARTLRTGRTFAMAAVADADGTFSVSTLSLPIGTWITATSTDSSGSTSEFAAAKLVT